MSGEQRTPVPRPSLPPLLWLVAGIWTGIALAERLIWQQVPLSRVLVGAAVVAAACLLAIRSRAWAGMAVVGCCAGVAIAALFWTSMGHLAGTLERESTGRFTGVAITDSSPGSFDDRSKVMLMTPAAARVEVTWPRDRAPEAGQAVEFFGTLTTGGSDEWARRRHQAGISATVKARVVSVMGWSRTLQGAVGPWRSSAAEAMSRIRGPGGDLLAGVVLGDRRRLADTQADQDFRTTGLSHLVAVSGSHLVVVAALVLWTLARCRVPRVASALVSTTIVGLYVVATGVQASAVRAWGMAVVASMTGLSGRRTDASAGLATAAAVALVAFPPVVFDLGFRLSVAAVAGLVLFARLAEGWVAEALPRFARALAGPLSLTLVAQAATAPITTPVFGTFSMIAPVANLFAGPLVTFCLIVGLAGVALEPLARSAGDFALALAAAAGSLTVSIAGRLARVPGASIGVDASGSVVGVVMAMTAVLVWAAWPRARAHLSRLLSAALTLVVLIGLAGPRPPDGLTLTALDVGQGDAVLIRDGPHAVLVDAGPGGDVLAQALRRHGVRRLEALVITHYHDDHYAGAKSIAGTVAVDRVIVAGGAALRLPDAASRLRCDVVEVLAGATFECGSVSLTVVSPAAPPDDPSANESSIVLLARTPGITALLTGDAEMVVIDPLLAARTIGDVDILKVGHHGSHDAVSAEMLRHTTPAVALISCGTGNRYGHPDSETVGLLEAAGARVRRTDLEGDLTVPLGATETGSDTAQALPNTVSYATLVRSPRQLAPPTSRGADEHSARPQTHLPDLERAGLPRSAGRGPPEEPGGRRRGSGLQHAGVRWGRCSGRRDSCRVQHTAVRLGEAARDREERRPLVERCL